MLVPQIMGRGYVAFTSVQLSLHFVHSVLLLLVSAVIYMYMYILVDDLMMWGPVKAKSHVFTLHSDCPRHFASSGRYINLHKMHLNNIYY